MSSRSALQTCLNVLSKPPVMRPGEVRPCAGCGRDIAGEVTAKSLGIAEHGGLGKCKACLYADRHGSCRPADEPPMPAVPLDPTWRQDALCVGTAPLFDIVDRVHKPPETTRSAAIRYCANCPVRRDCDEEAEANSETGLWGGKWRSGHGKGHHAVDLLDRPWLRARAAS